MFPIGATVGFAAAVTGKMATGVLNSFTFIVAILVGVVVEL